jgi:hypothetical protein
VMLRTLGIPTRLVTGYGPGQRNPFTGYFEVKQSDAHAWVEVYYPGLGWVPYDPTFGVPEAAPGVGSRFMAGAVFAAIGRFVARVVPEPVKHLLGATLGAVGAVALIALRTWPVAMALLLAASLTAVLWRRRRGRGRRGPPFDEAEAAFLEMEDALAAAGLPRAAPETPREYLDALAADTTLASEVVEAAGVVVGTFEWARFAPGTPSPEAIYRARASVGVVREGLRGRPRVHEAAGAR